MLIAKLLLLVISQIVLVQCIFPVLQIQKIDQNVIQRKRQDTVDMCRIYTAETANPNLKRSENRRSKRFADAPYTGVKSAEDDILRVENIVDKLYDEMAEKGQSVAYRRRNITRTTVTPNTSHLNKSRRFDFAPHLFKVELEEKDKPWDKPSEDVIDTDWFKDWKDGIVPYFIDPKTYDRTLQQQIVLAFDYFEKTTCIRMQRLREKPIDVKSLSNVEWIYITNPAGIRQCVHSNERLKNKGVQMVVLGYECMSQGEILHEVMHILGFSHEHTRKNRDESITIVWENIKPGYNKYFEIKDTKTDKQCLEVQSNDKECLLYDMPYDLLSILHYPPRAFSKNGQPTILAKNGVKFGQREALSEQDVRKVALVYESKCFKRNKEYLQKTCPTVNAGKPKAPIPDKNLEGKIKKYFKDRVWEFGIVAYSFRSPLDFSIEEKDNIQSVFKHIEEQTCIQFKEFKSDLNITEMDTHHVDRRSNDVSTAKTLPPTTKTSNTSNLRQKHEPSNKTLVKGSNKEPGVKIPTAKQIIMIDDKNDDDNTIDSKSNTERNIRTEEKAIGQNRVKRSLGLQSGRRHANTAVVLNRINEPGCKCPVTVKKDTRKQELREFRAPTLQIMLNISGDCFNSVNDLMHFFVHLLGLDHQHNMHDRDKFIKIDWDNIDEEFKKELSTPLPEEASVGFPYDYQSVMHFPWLRIKDGARSIMYPIWNDGWTMGHWNGLSTIDAQKINKIYNEECERRRNHVIRDRRAYSE